MGMLCHIKVMIRAGWMVQMIDSAVHCWPQGGSQLHQTRLLTPYCWTAKSTCCNTTTQHGLSCIQAHCQMTQALHPVHAASRYRMDQQPPTALRNQHYVRFTFVISRDLLDSFI